MVMHFKMQLLLLTSTQQEACIVEVEKTKIRKKKN